MAQALPFGYPDAPGWRSGPNEATSREAAEIAGRRARPLLERVLALLDETPGTPEELTQRFARGGEVVLLNTIRARCSQLHALGRVVPSGTFGKGESGKTRAIRWRVATPGELSLFLARKAAADEKGPDHG